MSLGQFTANYSKSTRTLYGKIYRQNAADQERGPHLCEPAQSKCIWVHISHEPYFMWKSTGKMPRTSWGTQIKHWPPPAFTLTVRTLQWTQRLKFSSLPYISGSAQLLAATSPANSKWVAVSGPSVRFQFPPPKRPF